MYGYGYQYGGISGGSIGATLAAAYKARVEADGGTYENDSCLTSFINSLNPYSGNLLLGLYPNAAAAYSLRLLNPDYTGDAIRVRRSSDNAEQDIGFVSGVLDTASLLTFCGVGDGFVTTWYDQSLNSRSVTQATATKQPKVVSSGALVTDGGKISILFDGTDDHLFRSSVAVSQPFTTFTVRKYSTTAGVQNAVGFQFNTPNWADVLNTTFRTYYGAYLGAFTANTNRGLTYSLGNGASSGFALNGSIVTGNAGTSNISSIYIGGNVTTWYVDGHVQEVIIYPSNQSSNRTLIETNINSYYGIY